MSSQYIYQRLPDETSIRVLILAPGEGEEPLSGVLKIIHLTSRCQTPRSATGWIAEIPYEAISYVWGSETKDHNIFLGGKPHRITANLSYALHQCRSDQPRALWADSICINQDEVEEKNHQVYLMGRIYASSQCTLICLGTDPSYRDCARNAFGLISDTNEMMRRIFQQPNFSWKPNSFPWPAPDDPLPHDFRWQSVAILIDLPWFWRGWVIQEVALGLEVCMLWAGHQVKFLDFIRTGIWYYLRAFHRLKPHIVKLKTPPLLLETFIHKRRAEATTFFPPDKELEGTEALLTLHRARHLGLLDPRDRIYAFMALPFIINPLPSLHPNYQQPYRECYRDFAIQYLAHTSDLNLLRCVAHEDTSEKSFDSTLATSESWVPQWDRKPLGLSVVFDRSGWKVTSFGQATSESAEFKISRGDIDKSTSLQVRAIIFNTISLSSRQFDTFVTIQDLITFWSHWSKHTTAARQHDAGADYHSLALLVALTAGRWKGASLQEWADKLKSYARLLQQSTSGSESPGGFQTSPDVQFCHEQLMRYAFGGHVVLLRNGYYGLGPRVVEQDDICAFVFGVGMPLVLRKCPEAGFYKVLGPAFFVSKQLDTVLGMPLLLHQLEEWENWDKLCGLEGWLDWGLKEENIVLIWCEGTPTCLHH